MHRGIGPLCDRQRDFDEKGEDHPIALGNSFPEAHAD
jgi:hypothetical protein